MGYGPSLRELGQQAASYVERIFNGAPAGELPFQGPTRFDFVINMKRPKRLASRSRRLSLWAPKLLTEVLALFRYGAMSRLESAMRGQRDIPPQGRDFRV